MKKFCFINNFYCFFIGLWRRKKRNMTGEDEVTIQDFLIFFPVLTLPAQFLTAPGKKLRKTIL